MNRIEKLEDAATTAGAKAMVKATNCVGKLMTNYFNRTVRCHEHKICRLIRQFPAVSSYTHYKHHKKAYYCSHKQEPRPAKCFVFVICYKTGIHKIKLCRKDYTAHNSHAIQILSKFIFYQLEHVFPPPTNKYSYIYQLSTCRTHP